MSEEFERQTQPGGEMDPPRDPPTAVGADTAPEGESGGGGARKALPATTGGKRHRLLGDWVARTLDVVEMMADATRETLLGGRKR